jgi:superfamily II DNA or RNA helicase
MELIVRDNVVIVKSPTEKEKNIIVNSFTLKDERSAFTRGGFSKDKVKNQKFYSLYKKDILFMPGLLLDVVKCIKENKIKATVKDERTKLNYQNKEYTYDELRLNFNPNFTYVEHQIRALRKMLSTRRGIIKATTSAGKCFGKNTEILMYDGSIKLVQDIVIDDIIMGWDSTPRKVMSITSGNDILYRIKYLKGNGSHIVNSSHVLTLKASRDLYKTTKKNDVIDISILDYLNQTKDFKRVWSLFQEPVLCWEEKKHNLEPYFLGVWLGDGRSDSPSITSIDEEIISYLYEYAEKFDNLSVKKYIQKNKNEITKELRNLNLINNKHIPKEYLIDSYENRLNLLAGLLDTDGYLDVKRGIFEFSNKNKNLANEVAFLSKSLGFYSSISEVEKSSQNGTIGTYYSVYIAGDVYKIPTKIKRKQSEKREKISHELKDPTKIGFEIEKLEDGEYFGFTLDGDGRFMLGDFIVSHNTEVVLAFCKVVNLKILVLVNKQDLGKQTAERLNNGGFPVLYRGSDKKGKIDVNASYVCTIGLAKELPNDFDVVIVDECHRASSKTFQDYLKESKAKAFYGFSATPEGNHNVDFMTVKKYLGNIIEEINAQELLEHNVIVYPSISFVENMMPNIPSNTTWDSVNEICLVNNTDRNELIKKLVEKHNDTTLILVKNIEHGKNLERIIDGSFFVSGSEDADTRKESIRRLNNKELKVLIASNIFNEGISINSIRVLINAAGGKSRIEAVQRLGRALRKDIGKTEAIVYDFYDVGNKFTSKHSKERMKIYEKVGFPVKILES